MRLEEIQERLREARLDGWLFFDHHRRDPLAYRVLGLAGERVATRRWYYLIPAKGEPAGLVHRIESHALDSLPGEKIAYSSWSEQSGGLEKMLKGCRRVAMQYSPQCAVPYVSMVDAGTVELVRKLGVEVASSADLIQYFEARWSRKNLESHLAAGREVDQARAGAFRLVSERLRAGTRIDEYEVKRFLRESFTKRGLVTDHGPIVAVNENASNPHYEPEAGNCREIRRGDCLLIDLWAKQDAAEAVYYDITWTAFCGEQPPEAVRNVFEVVRGARDQAIRRVQEAVAAKTELRGFEVDDAARGYIEAKGFGPFFFHRTGHSIGTEVHGAGANMDNLETHDERRIIAGTCFSIEPGIYLKEFGIRSEVNVYVGEEAARVTGETQTELVRV